MARTDRVYLRVLTRISTIDREIASGQFPNVKRSADLLEITERTVKRDLAMMRDGFGAPITHERGKGGFRYSKPGWSLPMQKIREGELLAFFIAENVLHATGRSSDAVVLGGALSKLAIMLPDEVSISMANLGELTSYQNTPFAPTDSLKLAWLAEAATERSTIVFDYFSPHTMASTRRTVDPYCLHNFAGDWYVIAYDHLRNDMRDFHAARLSKYSKTGVSFDLPTNWKRDDYLSRGFQMTRGGRLTTVLILFDSYQAQWIRERKHFHPDEVRDELDDGSLRLSFKIGESGLEAVARFCLTYAGNCVAEKPKKLRDLFKQKAMKAYDAH
ncbi:MAG: WYL domain-containing protein [Blastocatellia bacterium]|nr:WYL domain-containing protein [Blastocatellia bacterium]